MATVTISGFKLEECECGRGRLFITDQSVCSENSTVLMVCVLCANCGREELESAVLEKDSRRMDILLDLARKAVSQWNRRFAKQEAEA